MSTQNLKPFHGGIPIVMKLAGYAHDVIAIVYENEEKPGWFYLERPIEYWTSADGNIGLKRWMYLSCQTLFEIRSVDILSHGEINDAVTVMYVELSDKYYSNLRNSDLTGNGPDSLEEAETPDEELVAMLDRHTDDPETSTSPTHIPELRKTTKKEQEEQEQRLMHMLRNMPVPKVKH